MYAGFQTRIAETVTTDFRNFKLTRAIEFTDTEGTRYQLPVAASSDLASVPAMFWPLLPPFGDYALEAYLHDGLYQNWLLKWDGAHWVKACFPTHQPCDELFDRAMSLNPNITPAQRQILYRAVSEFGWHAFKEDRT